MAKLTKKQQLFVDEYLIDLNATQAAIRAGYSPETAKDIGCENLAKPNIKSEIDKALAIRSRRTGVNQDRVIQELGGIAFDPEEKTTDKLKALELLGKHLGMFVDKIDLTAPISIEIRDDYGDG